MAALAAYQASQSPTPGPTSQPNIDANPNLPQIGNDWYNSLLAESQLAPSYYGMIQPNVLSAYHQALANPYVGALPGTAAQIASQGGNAGTGLMGAGQNILNTSQDPQNALYDRTLQQVQDQARAANSAAGLGMSGVGAGAEDQAVNNFNIDWQNNQLGRQIQGAQGASGAFNAGLNDLTNTYQLPYQVSNQIPMNLMNMAQLYTNSSGALPQALANNANLYSQYSGMGLNQQNAQYSQAYQNQLNDYNVLNNTLMPLASAANQTWGAPGNTFANNLFGNSGNNNGFSGMQNYYYGNQLGNMSSNPSTGYNGGAMSYMLG